LLKHVSSLQWGLHVCDYILTSYYNLPLEVMSILSSEGTGFSLLLGHVRD